ncbi:TonB family protein [Rhodocytophaga rosea]|uniref:TonB family protein n=1 Tax=Rhodocytophaga rosea TaxID=2704465 RepID=A0A6C0GM04_9BACT|nr:TonB family protein [Rhodocytophaga rosea]QHT69055.1 TonB family protein [Rhodocytophaga rosea]
MRSFFTSVLLFLSISAFSQQVKVLGRIVDAKTDKPVKDASIIVEQTTHTIVSNPLGYFELIEQLPVKITVSHVGYVTSSVELTVDNPKVKIKIEPVLHSLEDLSIKGQVFLTEFVYNQAAYDSLIHYRQQPANTTTYAMAEHQCAFPGDMAAFRNYVANQLLKKKDDLTEAFASTVLFTVMPEGTISVDSISGVKENVVQLIRQTFVASPKWVPAFQGNNKVAMRLMQSIKYDPTVEIFQKLDIGPEYTGGWAEFYDLVGKNLKFPSQARKAKVNGKVFVQFVINESGELEDIQILKGLGYGCDEEVIRVIKLSSGKWIPGKLNNKSAKARVSVPVQFKTG